MSGQLAEGKPFTQVVQGLGSGSLTYQLPLTGKFDIDSVVATIDNAAGADIHPTLYLTNASGEVIAKKRTSDVIPAGGSGTVTWALRLADEAAAAAVTTAITKIADITLPGVGVFNVPLAFTAGFDFVEAHIWAKVPTGTYVGVPPVVRARFISPGAVLNRWRLIAAGGFTNISIAGADSSCAVGFAPQLANTADQQAAFAYTRVTWFNYQSNLGYKQWISDGMTFDQAFSAGGVGNYVNRWTGAGWLESDGYPGLVGEINLLVFPNRNPTTTGGDPDTGRFAAGSRLLVLGYKGT